jgi:hypothetical protein
MARIPLTWYPGPGTWHHSHISNLNKAIVNLIAYAVGKAILRQYGNSAVRPYGYDSSTWPHG